MKRGQRILKSSKPHERVDAQKVDAPKVEIDGRQLRYGLVPTIELEEIEDATKSIPCGPDIIGNVLDSVGRYLDAGYDRLYFHQIGPDQDGFFHFWERELRPALKSAMTGTLTPMA